MCVPSVKPLEVLLTSLDPHAFEPPLVVVKRDVVVRLGPCEDALDRGVRNLEERGGSRLLAALAHLADEALRTHVFRRNLLGEALLDRIADRQYAIWRAAQAWDAFDDDEDIGLL